MFIDGQFVHDDPCECGETIKLKDIPELQHNPMAIPFTSAIVGLMLNPSGGSRNILLNKDIVRFGKMEVRYRGVYSDDEGNVTEISLVFDQERKPAAMIIREFENGEYQEDQTQFIQYETRGYSKSGVMALINKLPNPLINNDKSKFEPINEVTSYAWGVTYDDDREKNELYNYLTNDLIDDMLAGNADIFLLVANVFKDKDDITPVAVSGLTQELEIDPEFLSHYCVPSGITDALQELKSHRQRAWSKHVLNGMTTYVKEDFAVRVSSDVSRVIEYQASDQLSAWLPTPYDVGDLKHLTGDYTLPNFIFNWYEDHICSK